VPQIDPRLFPPFLFQSLRCGAYLINYIPNASLLVSYEGTLRLECHSGGRTASGDLYQRGQGALFPAPGLYHIYVEAHWDADGAEMAVVGEASIVVSAAVDKDHAEAALKVLSTPDTLLTLVLGGDHLQDGIEAIHAALENPILRPHYAYIEAKRLAERFGKRKPNLKAAADLIDDTTITSPAEIKKAAMLVKAGSNGPAADALVSKIKTKVATQPVGIEIESLLDTL
jgi:hypothetical protein